MNADAISKKTRNEDEFIVKEMLTEDPLSEKKNPVVSEEILKIRQQYIFWTCTLNISQT